MILVVCATEAFAVPSGTYTGHTKGGLKVRIEVRKNRITSFVSSVRASCYSGNRRISYALPATRSIEVLGDGSFSIVFQVERRVSLKDDKHTLKGRFRGGKVSGSMKLEGLCWVDTTFRARK